MSKNKHGDLFNTSLTEIIIILFFVLMLFALFNINKVNQENVSLGDEVDELTAQKDDLEDENGSLEAENKVFIEVINNSNQPITLMPPAIEYITRNTILEKEKKQLEKDNLVLEEKIKELTPGDEDPIDGLGDGDCKEGGNWINSKCADYCWAIENDETNRPYDLLVDVGVCNSHVVVQRSNWLEKAEVDFQVVNGALDAADQQKMSQAELYNYLDTIKEPGFLQEPKQCFHVVRVIDLGAKSVDAWNKNLLYVQERVSTETLTSGASYERVKASFPANACALPTPPKQKSACQKNHIVMAGDSIWDIILKYEISLTELKSMNAEIFEKQSTKTGVITIGTELIVDDCVNKNKVNPPKKSALDDPQSNLKDELLGTSVPSLSKALFEWDNVVSCRRAKGKSNPKFDATFNILITENNRASVQSYTFDETNYNNRLVALDAKSTIERLREGIKHASSSENSDNNISLKVTFNKDMCRNVSR